MAIRNALGEAQGLRWTRTCRPASVGASAGCSDNHLEKCLLEVVAFGGCPARTSIDGCSWYGVLRTWALQEPGWGKNGVRVSPASRLTSLQHRLRTRTC